MGQVDYNNIIIISIYVAHVLNPVRIHEGGAVEDRFMNLQDKYQTTIRNVTSILFKRSFHTIKAYLLESRKIPQADITKCKDKESLIALVTDRCSITQCHLLYHMAERFKEKRALKHMDTYNSYKEEVYSKIKTTAFSKILFHEKEFSGEIQVSNIINLIY